MMIIRNKSIAILTLLAIISTWANTGRGEDANTAPAAANGVTIYDADPQHLWNRLHHAIYVRTDANGRQVGADRLDPLLWTNTRHLFRGKPRDAATAVLNEFLSRHGEQLFSDPLRRAILQRDLWAVFDWAVAAENHLDTAEQKEARSRLLVRLSAAIDRVALAKDQIQNLPDNFAAAVASKSLAARYDSEHPQAEFLPPDLFDPNGPWVCLTANDGRTITPVHDRDFGGRSTFLVLLRLPDGCKATLAYLAKLRRFQNPWIADPPVLNPELPQFPEGTEFAFVRRAILIDNQGDLVPTRLVESIQLRHFREISGPHDAPLQGNGQDVYELQLSRTKLFAGEAGGLFSPETDFLNVQFQGFGIDEFERTDRREKSGRKLERAVRDSCTHCHSAPGILSARSLQSSFAERGTGRAKLAECRLDDAVDHAIGQKRSQPSWGLLQGLRIAARANSQPARP